MIHELPPGAPVDDLQLELVDGQHLQGTLIMAQSYDSTQLLVSMGLFAPACLPASLVRRHCFCTCHAAELAMRLTCIANLGCVVEQSH